MTTIASLALLLASGARAAGVPVLERAVLDMQKTAARRPHVPPVSRTALAPQVARRVAAEARLTTQSPFEGPIASRDPRERYLVLQERDENGADGSHQYGAAVVGRLDRGGRFEAQQLLAWHRRLTTGLERGRGKVELSLYSVTLEGRLVREARQTTVFDPRARGAAPDGFRHEEFRRVLPRLLAAHGVPSLKELIERARKTKGHTLKSDQAASGVAESTVFFRETARLGGLGGRVRTPFLAKLAWTEETLAGERSEDAAQTEQEQRTLQYEVAPDGRLLAVSEDRTYSAVVEWQASSADPAKLADLETTLGKLLPR